VEKLAQRFQQHSSSVDGNLHKDCDANSMPKDSNHSERIDQAMSDKRESHTRGGRWPHQLLSFARKQPLAPVVDQAGPADRRTI